MLPSTVDEPADDDRTIAGTDVSDRRPMLPEVTLAVTVAVSALAAPTWLNANAVPISTNAITLRMGDPLVDGWLVGPVRQSTDIH
jgi:hypothetical protein